MSTYTDIPERADGSDSAAAADINLLMDNIRYLRDYITSMESHVTYSPPCGKTEWFDDRYSPSTVFPYLCLSDDDKVLNASNWPDLVPHLRAKLLKYMPGTSSEQSAFNVTAMAIASNVATLTFGDITAEKAILSALAEDQLVHGSFAGWRTVTLSSAIGAIAVGTYPITAISASNRTISFVYTASNASASVTATVAFYPHRVESATDSSGTMARHFAVKGRTLVSNDAETGCFAGLRRRDRMQVITGVLAAYNSPFNINCSGAFTPGTSASTRSSASTGGGYDTVNFSSANSPNSRTGHTTDPRSLIAIPYMWGKRYVA